MSNVTGGRLTTKVGLNIREAAGTGYPKVGSIKSGVTVDFVGDPENEWVKITYNNVIGYINCIPNYVDIKSTKSEVIKEEEDTPPVELPFNVAPIINDLIDIRDKVNSILDTLSSL